MCGNQFDCILYTIVKANVYTNSTENTNHAVFRLLS